MSDAQVQLSPVVDRWRPTRAGLVSVWRYWDEVFTFHRGRLLLRGPNGSGKSLALELLLPFLLDADASPARLTSAVKSRGGLFDRLMTGADEPTRTGFAWVEFRRGDEVFTVGARIRASQSTRRADVDYFTTTLAVGHEVHLLDAHRVPLSKAALAEAIGTTGRVHSSGEEHRAAVREVLYPGFGPDRYASVIGALLTLRKEKLSQQLVSVEELSKVLSDALPPLDDHDIAAVAEGFERLDRRRDELKALEAELHTVRLLAGRQRDYAQAVVVAGAAAVVRTETRRDDVTRAERRARDDFEAVRAEADVAEAERRELEERLDAIGVEIEALKDSNAYKAGVALTDLRAQASRLADFAERARRSAADAAAAAARAVDERTEAAEQRDRTAANLALAARDVHAAGEPIGGGAVVAQAEETDDADEAERLVLAWLGAQRTRLAEVRTALEAHERAVALRALYEAEVEKVDKILADRDRARRTAEADAAAAAERYRVDVEQWASGCEVLGADRVAAALPRPADEPAAVDASLALLRASLESELAVARRDLQAERDAAVAERQRLRDERARWEQSSLPDPELPAWRTARTGLAGAPLWLLVDPAADAPPEAVDRLEAALTGAGLLDAWVQPDGSVALADGRADVVLTARPVDGGDTLASLLVPVAATGVVPTATVAAVLSSIPVVDTALPPAGDIAIGRDGTYRLGSAVGRGPDRPACFLGAPARERHRQARLAELDADLAGADERLTDLGRRAEALERQAAAARSELADAPSGAAVLESRRTAGDAAVRLDEARSRLEAAREDIRRAEDDVRAALRILTSSSVRHGLPAERTGLAAVEDGLARLQSAVATWARRRREERAAVRQLGRAEARAGETAQAAARAHGDHEASAREATQVAERVAALESTVDVEYGQVLTRISALDTQRATARTHAEELRRRVPELQQRVGELRRSVEDAAQERERAEATRDLAHRRLVAIAHDLGADARILPTGALDGVTAVLGFARAVLADHGDGAEPESDAIERLSERVREQVHHAGTALGSRVDVDRELTGGQVGAGPFAPAQWWVLRTTAGGLRRGSGELVDALTAELERGRTELADEEERLFEQTLAGSVRRALADRIRQANALVDGINTQLDAIRTAAAGVRVRLQWAVDPEQLDAVKAARALLLRDPADLTDDERASLQDFVRARVDQARAELQANAPWEARLRETLDYRRWHRFTLQLAHRDWEGFQPATARRLARLSTGERSIALHLPMIASVAAHYAGEDGRPSVCPRLILLDELFAGVDAANRSQLFGTFSTWDLDAVFTSDHEWCQYATLDGIAIHHLHPGGTDDPVTSTRFTWDGHQRRIDPGASAA